jgi:16S rRNA (guanine527-N7)-methyltransferase
MLITDEKKAIDFLEQNLDSKTFSVLCKYVEILSENSKLFNLISRNTIDQIWQRHILDSYQLINYINKEDSVVDIGSGAGLPGVVLRILGISKIRMIDSSNKKIKFINATLENLEFKPSAIHTRIEDFKTKTDILTARALKPLKEIFSLINKNITVSKKILLLKGARSEEEINDASHLWDFQCKLHKSITSENSFIIEIDPQIFSKK